MANSWLRLWHDMPNDPKWRTIARISKQPIALVQAVYIHLLVSASQNVTRGHVDVTTEDLASALDASDEDIEAIRNAMQGRVLDGDNVSGWGGRQVRREDMGSEESGAKSASQRKREQRERQKNSGNQQAGHEASRNVTTDKDKEEIKNREDIKDKNLLSELSRTDGETESDKSPAQETDDKKPDPVDLAFEGIFWIAGLRKDAKVKAKSAFKTKYREHKTKTGETPKQFATLLADDIRGRVASGVLGTDKLLPTSYLNGERWNDENPAPQPVNNKTNSPAVFQGPSGMYVDFDKVGG